MTSIREKVKAFLEGIESSEEIINSNVVDWNDRKLDREAGAFTADEIANMNQEREVHPNLSNDEENPEAGLSIVRKSTVVLGDPNYYESTFAQKVREALVESDYAGIRPWNDDKRIAAWMVKDALSKAMPEAKGLNVDAIDDNKRFAVSGVDFEAAGIELPEEITIETDDEPVTLELKNEDEPTGMAIGRVYAVKNED